MKKTLLLTSIAVISIGAATVSYANSQMNTTEETKTESSTRSCRASEKNNMDQFHFEKMISMMNERGLTDAAETMKNGNRQHMHQLMNSMNDKDYDKMVQVMKDTGYENMSKMMDNIESNGTKYEHKHNKGQHRGMTTNNANNRLGCQ